MADTNGANSPDRLDRIEGIIEALADRQHLIEDEFVRLLRAQVVTVDGVENLKRRTEEKFQALAEAQKHADKRMEELAAAQKRADERMNELAVAQKHADERMNTLLLTVDEIIRGRKAQ
jgi:seryl-tRNA synthetase